MNPYVIPTRMRRLSIATLLALVVGGLTVLAAPADAAGLNLHRGSRGASVYTLETRLAKVAGLPRSSVDRRYRLATVRAVKRFQKARHLRVTGTVNQRTWNLVGTAYAQATAPPAWRRPTWAAPAVTAHRGGTLESPENTLTSLRRAVGLGVDSLEFDVRTTSDHQLVLLHDARLDRTTTCTGLVYTKTLAEVQQCLTKVGAQVVPTLEDVLTYLQTVDVTLSPEIKDFGADFDDDELAAYVQAIRDHGLLARTQTQSFAPSVFAKIQALEVDGEPAMKLVYLSGTVVNATAVLAAGADIASIQMSALKRSNVDVYHQYGVPVYTWTAVNDAGLKAAWDLHVDAVITDVPTAAVRLYG